MDHLCIDGVNVGKILAPRFAHLKKRVSNYGSIIAVVATDAPLQGHQLQRLAKRAALGVGRVGSYAAHSSGEIILAFSTANKIPRETKKMVYRAKFLLDQRMDPLYKAVIEATEESIVNALCMATDMEGADGNFCPAIPLKELRSIMKSYRNLHLQNLFELNESKFSSPKPAGEGEEENNNG